MSGFMHLFPVEASSGAASTDRIFLGLLGLSAVICLLVIGLVVGFSIRYRRGSKAPRGDLPEWLTRDFEIGWTSATLFVGLFVFWWAASSQLSVVAPPRNAMEIHVVAKQWMWKTEDPSGVREIDTLHVPTGVPVKLIMTSQDVIHSFYVPAFRIKQDVLPGRYTETWFKATRPGVYDLFCAEYCGTDHSRMTGKVVVMRPADYARWTAAQPEGDSLATQGRAACTALGCSGCHAAGASVHAPLLNGVFGHPVQLADGRTVSADEGYLRDSIMLPRKDVVAGYDPVMPSYQGVASEDQVVALIAYLRSLSAPEAPR